MNESCCQRQYKKQTQATGAMQALCLRNEVYLKYALDNGNACVERRQG